MKKDNARKIQIRRIQIEGKNCDGQTTHKLDGKLNADTNTGIEQGHDLIV